MIDTTYLPQVWVTWATTKNKKFDKRYWLSPDGKKQDHPEDWMYYPNESDHTRYYWNSEKIRIGMPCQRSFEKNPIMWINSNSNVRFAIAKYHPDIDKLEVSAVGYDTSRKEGKHEWQYLGDRFFIGRDKTIVDQNGNMVNRPYSRIDKNHSPYNNIDLLRTMLRMTTALNFVDELKKFIGGGSFTIGSGRSITIKYPWHLQKWYETKQKTRGDTKTQKLVDKLIAMPLSEIAAEQYPPKLVNTSNYYLDNVVVYEKLTDGWHVLRFLKRTDGNLYENERFYLHDNGETRFAAKGTDGWVPSTSSYYDRYYEYFANKEEAMANCKRIKYACLAVNEKGNEYCGTRYILTMIRYPEIEQLIKMSNGVGTSYLFSSTQPLASIKDLFGYYNKKEKNALKKVGLNKFQFDHYINDHSIGHYCSRRGIHLMHEIFGGNLSHMDNDSFVKYYRAAKEWSDLGVRNISRLNINTEKFFKNLTRLAEKNLSIYRIIADTINLFSSLDPGTQPAVDWYFENVSDAVRMHDAITALSNAQRLERQARWNAEAAARLKREEEKRKKLDEERQVYNYEDDNFIIRLPKDCAEIINEGSHQHICIGGYASRHSIGDTNLFFLRKKGAEDVPFYAIEMNNQKNITQIHGFGNKWLGNDPAAIPTVMRWLRKHGIKCSDSILTCTAKGYGSINQYVPLPVID